MPKPVYEDGDVTVLWNQAVHTDREITANRPDVYYYYRYSALGPVWAETIAQSVDWYSRPDVIIKKREREREHAH